MVILRAVSTVLLCAGGVSGPTLVVLARQGPPPSEQVDLGCDFSEYSPVEQRTPKPLAKETPDPHPHCYYRRLGEKAEAVIQVLVRNDGRPRKVCIVKGHVLCAPAAAEAVWRWRFKPWPTKTGKPRYAVYQVRFNFVGPKSGQSPEPGR